MPNRHQQGRIISRVPRKVQLAGVRLRLVRRVIGSLDRELVLVNDAAEPALFRRPCPREAGNIPVSPADRARRQAGVPQAGQVQRRRLPRLRVGGVQHLDHNLRAGPRIVYM